MRKIKENKKQIQHRKLVEKAIRHQYEDRSSNYLPEDEDDILQPKWIDKGGNPWDLTTLVINIFMYKLNVGLSLETSQVLSLNGEFIYVVVKADLMDLKKIAEERGYIMQFDIGITDLISLEPWDKFLRPLRKCESWRIEIEELQESLHDYYAIIEGNFHNTLNDKIEEYNKSDALYGDIKENEWDTYSEYLKLLKEGFEDFKKHTFSKPHIKGIYLRSLALYSLSKANKNQL